PVCAGEPARPRPGAEPEAPAAPEGDRAAARQDPGARSDPHPTAALLVPGTSEGGARARRRQEAPRQAGGDPRADGAARDGPRHGRGQTRPGMSDAARLPVPPPALIMDVSLRG